MRWWSRLLFYYLLLHTCLFRPLRAQYLQKPVRILTTKDGLPQSFVSGLVQDKEGFVWIATRNGLVRYDGIHFKLFQHSSRDTATISSNLLISLALDVHNRIWVEHESSDIDCFDPVTETTEHITDRPLFRSHPVRFVRKGWLADAAGNLWCLQKAAGFYKYNWKQNSITHFTRHTHGLPSDTIKGLLQDRMQQVWVVSQQGISRYQQQTGRLEHRLFPFATDFNNDENWNAQIVAVHERKNGEIMLGDRRQLIFYNPATKTFRTVLLPVFPKTGIRWIQEGPDGYEYLESEGIVYRYNETSGLVAVGDIGLVSFRDTHSFLIDRSGFIWLGTNASGIHQIDLTAPFFEFHPTAFSFHYDLLRQKLGIELDKFAGWPLTDKEFPATSYWFRSTYDAHQRLWLVLRDKVAYYDTSQKKYVLLPPVPDVSEQANLSWGIRGICFAPDGTLWVIGDKGDISYIDTLHQKWITFMDAARMKKNYSDFTLHDVVADADKLWISGGGVGLFCIDIRTKHIQQLNQQTYPGLLPTDLLLGLQQDPTRSGLLWIGTYEGLVCLNKKTLKSNFFSVEQGLPDNTIYAIQTDKAGYLWLSTNKGLCRFHPVTHEVKVFQTADGLPGDEFNRFHSMKLPDGRLAFGGTDGWTLFDPTMIKADNYQPPVAFTGFKINNVPVSHRSADRLLAAPLNSLTELSLPYDQNSLTFEFAGLEFNRPQKLLYRYWLKAYDDQWIVTPTPIATYTKLPPGHYILNVNATNTTGQWSPHIRTLRLVIRPPFWRTWWAYGLYVLLLAGLVWAYIQYRLNQERLRQEVSMKEREAVQLKAVDELKTRFFSNITHEFRTPLTLILTPAQQLKPTLHLQNQHRWIAAIERNAYQLLRLINQLLDLSKLESGSLQVYETRGSIRRFLQERIQAFQQEAETNGISLSVRANADPGDYWFDADKLEHIVNNLLANALKFTPSGGQVELVFFTEKPTAAAKQNNTAGEIYPSVSNGIYLTVSDTGTGIPQADIPNIFNRFYQVNTTNTSAGNPKGSGIGLSLVKELVELQGGTIEVCSPGKEGGWSTCFTIWLPYRQVLASDLPAPEKLQTTQPSSTVIPPRPYAFSTIPAGEEAQETASVLIIEDNTELAEFIADSLPKAYHLNRAANGAAGLEMAFELMPDLVISDVLMPVMDGFECCRKLKADERTSHIPVILLTAKASFDSRIEGLTRGADDYLTKPFHVQELQLRVANLLERQRRIREKLRQELSRPGVEESASSTGTQTGTQDVFIQKLYDLIEEKLDDTSFGVQELASEIGMSRTNLHNKLKAVTGMPAGEIIRNYRLKRAAQFLQEGFNSSETAYRTGFDSPAYFSKCFREFYLVTPLEYAQKTR